MNIRNFNCYRILFKDGGTKFIIFSGLSQENLNVIIKNHCILNGEPAFITIDNEAKFKLKWITQEDLINFYSILSCFDFDSLVTSQEIFDELKFLANSIVVKTDLFDKDFEHYKNIMTINNIIK